MKERQESIETLNRLKMDEEEYGQEEDDESYVIQYGNLANKRQNPRRVEMQRQYMNQLAKDAKQTNTLIPPQAKPSTIVECKSLQSYRNTHLDEPPVLNFYDSSNNNFQTLNNDTIEPMDPYDIKPSPSK